VNRREVITLLNSAVAAWPVVARAQQPPMPVVGFLRSTGTDGFSHLIASLRKGLNEYDYFEGRNIAIESRFAENRPERLPALTADLIDRRVAAIVANTPAALVAKAATSTIPIVFATGSDPVRDGLVTSLNRPGANVTGVVFLRRVRGKAAGATTSACAQCHNCRGSHEFRHS
jgi:putative tryptophan/tyrosine transport system substrate-binding protein